MLMIFFLHNLTEACFAHFSSLPKPASRTFKNLQEADYGGVANGTSKNVGLRKFWQDLEISEAFLISLEVSFFHGLL